MIKKSLLCFLISLFAFIQKAMADDPPCLHSTIGTENASADGSIKVRLVHKMQQFDWKDKTTLDKDIYSPKSVNIHPNGKKFYVNSLEGAATVVYEMHTWRKLAVVSHRFDERHRDLWAPASGLFHFTHYAADKRPLNNFHGKPVESTFSHGGRYLWVPYYRRSYDINAQDPSAMAVIDTERDTIIRIFETGPLPKMVACSNDGKTIAVSHWGDNTVATIDISSKQPADWHYTKLYIVDYQLKLNYSLTESVNRDSNSGYTLRGTVFTPDDHYLLVGCMGGGGGIAVIDLQKREYLGRVLGMRAGLRHIILKNGYIYLSSNSAGIVQRMLLNRFLDAVAEMKNHTASTQGCWEECAVLGGARTIEASPSGRFIFAACNRGSKLCVVDTRSMKMVLQATADSYPVGLDISKDGSIVITTSQGRNKLGGNAVNIFSVTYAEPEKATDNPQPRQTDTTAAVTPVSYNNRPTQAAMPHGSNWLPWGMAVAALFVVTIVLVIRRRHQAAA